MEFIVFLILIPVFITCFIACFLCAEAAENKGRSYGGWFWLAFFCSPFLVSILLIALGDTEEKRKEKLSELKEVIEKITTDNKSIQQESTAEKRGFKPLGKTINDMYKK